MTHAELIATAAIQNHPNQLRDALAYAAFTMNHSSEQDFRIIFGRILTKWLGEDHDYQGGG